MQTKAEWSVTNLTDGSIKVVRAFEKKTKTEAHVCVEDRRSNYWGSYPIPPGEETDLSVDFFVCPVPRGVEDGVDHTFKIELIDMLGNRYKERVKLRGRKKVKPKKPDPGEAVHALKDPVEKQVVAVLKDEVTRYRDCGRRVGGLGSVQATRGGRTFRGVGTDSRSPDQPMNQSIFEDAEPGKVSSDNAAGLVKFYEQLDEEEKSKMVAAIASRMSRDSEYAPIGYFGLLVLFRIGHLHTALKTAGAQLQGDDAYGFSDFLRLIDGMLRFEHPSFTEEDLDEIEGFVRGIEDHSFRILERVAAVRAFRVRVGASGSEDPKE